MEYGDKIRLGPNKIAVWFGGEIKLIDQIDSQSVLLRTDEVDKLRELLNQSKEIQLDINEAIQALQWWGLSDVIYTGQELAKKLEDFVTQNQSSATDKKLSIFSEEVSDFKETFDIKEEK